MLEHLRAPFMALHILILYINDLPEGFVCNITIHGDITTVCSKCDQGSNLWRQLQLVSELQSDLQDIVECGSK